MLDKLAKLINRHATACVEQVLDLYSGSTSASDAEVIRNGGAVIGRKLELEFMQAFQEEILSKLSSELVANIKESKGYAWMEAAPSIQTSHPVTGVSWTRGLMQGVDEDRTTSDTTAQKDISDVLSQQLQQQILLQNLVSSSDQLVSYSDDQHMKVARASSQPSKTGMNGTGLPDTWTSTQARRSMNGQGDLPLSATLPFIDMRADRLDSAAEYTHSHSAHVISPPYMNVEVPDNDSGQLPSLSPLGASSNLQSALNLLKSTQPLMVFGESEMMMPMGNVSMAQPPPPPPPRTASLQHRSGHLVVDSSMLQMQQQQQQQQQQQMRRLLAQQQQQQLDMGTAHPQKMSHLSMLQNSSSNPRFQSSPQLELPNLDAAAGYNQMSQNQMSQNQMSQNQMSQNQMSQNQMSQSLMSEQMRSAMPQTQTTASYLVPSETGEVDSMGQPRFLQKQLPARFAMLPMLVQQQILLLIAACPCITIEDFDEKVLQKMVMLRDHFGVGECVMFVDSMAVRMRNKHSLMKNGPGYLDVAVCGHMDMLKARGSCAANANIQQYAEHVLSESVYEQLVAMILTSSSLTWSHLDRGHIHALSKLPVDVVPVRLAELSKRSYKNVDNIQGCIMSVLNSRVREGQAK